MNRTYVIAALVISLSFLGGLFAHQFVYPSYPIELVSYQTESMTPSRILLQGAIVGDYFEFNITIANTGTNPIYCVGRCGTSLSFQVFPPDAVGKAPNPFPGLGCATVIDRVDPGRTAMAFACGLADKENAYVAAEAGTFIAELNFVWSYDSANEIRQTTSFLVEFVVR